MRNRASLDPIVWSSFGLLMFVFGLLGFVIAQQSANENTALKESLTGPVTEAVVLPNGEQYKVLTLGNRRFLAAEIIETVEGGPTCESLIVYGSGTRVYNPVRFECHQRQSIFGK
ncbi:MAG: hypothetical protein AAB641_01050 [Patescibacteria group bacterium]